MICINLIPSVRREAKARKARLLKWASGLGLYIALLLLAAYMSSRYAVFDTCDLDMGIKKASAQAKVSSYAALNLNEQWSEAMQKFQTAQAVGQQPDWGRMLSLLAHCTDDGVFLDYCRLDKSTAADASAKVTPAPAKKTSGPGDLQIIVQLGGRAKEQSNVSAFVLKLEKTGLFDRVRLVKTNSQPFRITQAVSFQIECVLQASPGGNL